MAKKLTQEEFINRCKLKHNNKYDYSLVNYINGRNKVRIICSIHGWFEQKASTHAEGIGCRFCGQEETRKKNNPGIKPFINKANSIHNNYYDYSLVKYINNTLVTIICPIHGKFQQVPRSHISGHGCSKCNQVGEYSQFLFEARPEYKNVQSYLYFVKFEKDREKFYKIGITINKNKIRKFHGAEKYKIVPISIIDMKLYDAFLSEQKFKIDFQQYMYTPKIKFDGYTECFKPEIYNIMFKR